jgi:hypothetical protein
VRFIVLVPLLWSLSACSARQSNQALGGAPDSGPNYDPSQISVPFLVDDHYIPSGCMGDCITNVVIDSDCPARSSDDAQGDCHHFVFTKNTRPDALGWAGVLWQTTEKNWGSEPGRTIMPGATEMHFFAAGKSGGEALNILVGGMDPTDTGSACDAGSGCSSGSCDPSGACTAAHHDTLNVLAPVKLTTAFVKFDVPFGSSSYGSEVLSGFGWTAEMPHGTDKIEFYVDDLRWE